MEVYMSLIIIEGIDRSGKSTLAREFESQGYRYVHFSAPNSKYYKSGYVGPSYLDEMVDFLVSLSGQNVVLDRSHYGELVWPYVYGRNPLLSEDDIEILREIEDQNDVVRIMMHDDNTEAHWKRCVDNNEPLSRTQFDSAGQLYDAIVTKYGFTKLTKPEIDKANQKQEEVKDIVQAQPKTQESNVVKIDTSTKLTPEQIKLQQANAINDIMSSRIVKRKGNEYDLIENKIREFLNSELAKLLGTYDSPQLSAEEITILKALASRVIEKRA
jgi:hypothetical protein